MPVVENPLKSKLASHLKRLKPPRAFSFSAFRNECVYVPVHGRGLECGSFLCVSGFYFFLANAEFNGVAGSAPIWDILLNGNGYGYWRK